MEWSAKGQEYLQAARRLHHMAIDYFRRQEHAKALQNILEALKCRRYALPDSHPQILATLEFLIHVLSQSRPLEEQVPYLEMLLEGKKARLGQYHLETEQVMSQLASVYERLGKKTEAEKLNHEIWKIRCMSSSERQAKDFQDVFDAIPARPQKKKAPTLASTMNDEDLFKPFVRTSPFVDSNEWMERLKALMKLKPEEREAMKARWEAEDHEKKMKKLFTEDFSQNGLGDNLAHSDQSGHDDPAQSQQQHAA